MNPRLLSYLRSLGLAADATDDQSLEFHQGLRGIQASIANALNYSEADQQARTNCDLMIKSIGYDPVDPSKMLVVDTERTEPETTQQADESSPAAGDLESARAEGVQFENQRVAVIRELAEMSGTPDELVRTLVADPQLTIGTARQRLLEDHRQRTRGSVTPDVPAVHSRNSVSGMSVDIACAAMLHRSGVDPITGWVSGDHGNITPRRARGTDLEQIADQAWEYREASMADIVRMAARIDGITVPSTGTTRLMQSYLAGVRAFSTSALSNIFTTNMNSQLLSAFEEAADSTTGGWVRDSDVANFQTNERARMLKGGALQRLPRGGSAEHEIYEDVVETFKIARYAKQFVIDDQDIIDDTFGGASQHAPSDMGLAAANLRADLIYSILLGNPNMRDAVALFQAATHGNLNTSAALAIGTLSTARKAMRIQQENGRNLNIMPQFLIIPPALEDTAIQITEAPVVVITGSTDSVRPAMNAQSRSGLTIVSDARLENGVTDPTDMTGATVNAGSATSWWLSAAANNKTIECAYLRGTGRRPQVRSKILDSGTWGIGWDINMDIGAKAIDWLGMQKNTA